MQLRLFRDAVDLRVRNGGGPVSLKRLRRRRRNGGRGLDIVDALVDAWSIDSGRRGITITIRMSIDRDP